MSFSLPDLTRLLRGDAIPLLRATRLTVRLLKKSELGLVVGFRQEIFERGIGDPDFVHPEPDEVKAAAVLLDEDGISFGVFDIDRLVAYTSMCLPRKPETLAGLGLLTAISECCEFDQAAYMAANMVSPSHRGGGIQTDLVTLKFQVAPMLGRSHRFGLCSLTNGIALRAHLKYYNVVNILKIDDANFGTLTRFLTHSPVSNVQTDGPVHRVSSADEETQMHLLRSGYRGVACCIQPTGLLVGYRSLT